jgi:hypothetical protein
MVSDRLTPLERVLDRLKGVKAQNGYFIAFCPSHDDRRERSLSPNFRAKWVGLYPSSRHEDAGDLS